MLAPSPAARARTLSDEELATLWRASAALAPKSRAIVRLLALTGARRGEVGGLALGELDLEAGRWTLPATRAENRRPLVRPLGPLALAELGGVLPTGRVAPSHRLFGRTGAGPFAGRSKLEARLDELTYDRSDPSAAVASALLRWHAHVAALVGAAEGAAVVPLRTRAA